ncbi:hypothetical protein [Phenylobacterium sp.]|uniref:hypothetical protein n=1 Tax=Phenylobacterium sp. TaxID=1871053 RepID=UPI0025D66045|nr:hypothetical protein [Phenylobacterium sp.]MBX3484337.1 hypothetical protein [Phenylobacterium sp.]MCW5759339.1 hypothetical protein [Phenylobacterium sp.]
MPRLTERAIESLAAEAEDYTVRDTGVTGLGGADFPGMRLSIEYYVMDGFQSKP